MITDMEVNHFTRFLNLARLRDLAIFQGQKAVHYPNSHRHLGIIIQHLHAMLRSLLFRPVFNKMASIPDGFTPWRAVRYLTQISKIRFNNWGNTGLPTMRSENFGSPLMQSQTRECHTMPPSKGCPPFKPIIDRLLDRFRRIQSGH